MYSKHCCYHEYSDILPNTLEEIHYISKLKVSHEIHHCLYFLNSAKVLGIRVKYPV